MRGRSVLIYTGAALVLVLMVALSATTSAILEYRGLLGDSIGRATHNAVTIIKQQQTAHRSLRDAAETVTLVWNRPRYRLSVFDNGGKLIFDSAPGASSEITGAIATLFGAPRAEAPVPGGHIVVSTNPSVFAEGLGAHGVTMAPAMLIAVVVAFVLSQLIATEARRQAVERTLQSIHEGDFTQNPVGAAATPEIAAITAAYNTFALNLQETLAEREKAADSIRDFVSDASHQLKTPLTIIIGYLDPVMTGLIVDDEQRQQILGKIAVECRRMRDMIEKLTALARLDSAVQESPRIVDAEAVVHEVVESMSPVAPNLHVDVSTDGAACVVMDGRGLRDAITNIIMNAVKYAPLSPVDVRVTTAEDCVVVEVADSGPGMSREDRLQAFDRFHRGSASTKVPGSGLGLAIVKKAVERAKGRVTLESEEGRGTTVTIYIPRAPVEVTTTP